LSAYGARDALEWTQTLSLPVPDEQVAPSLTITRRGPHICLTYGTRMYVFTRQGDLPASMHTVELGASVVSVAASGPHARTRIAVAFEEGACVVWPGERRVERFASEMIDPVVCLTPDGLLVAAG